MRTARCHSIFYRLILACILFAAGLPVAWAGESDNRVWRSAYFLGRGDAGIAIADYEDAIFYNPAGLAQGKGVYKRTVLVSPHIELSQATRDLARQLIAEEQDAVDTVREYIGRPHHAALYNFTGLLLRRAALGIFASSTIDLLTYKSPDDGGLEVVELTSYQNVGTTFTLAESFMQDRLHLGLTAKYVVRGKGHLSVSVADAESARNNIQNPEDFLGTGTGTGADLGLMYRFDSRSKTQLGLTIENVGNTVVVPDLPTEQDLTLYQTVNLGLAVQPTTKTSNLKLLLDYRDILSAVETNTRKKIHIGTELNVKDFVGVTGGLNQGYPTFGFYLDTYILRIDLGMYGEEAGNRVGTRPDTRYYLRLFSGF